MFDDSDSKSLEQQIREYHNLYRNPRLPPFHVHPVEKLRPHESTPPEQGWHGTERSWRPGCYALFSLEGKLMYVGKASLGASIGTRLGDDKHDDWIKEAHWVQMVEVREAFEAPSLEEYLIARLRPPRNRQGVRGEGSG